MLIANPIYDVVFKRLMQNTRVARFFIETLTGESLDEMEFRPQEFVYADEQKILAVSRYDFVATIKIPTGSKKVHIEIYKAMNAIDVIRFQNEQNKRNEESNWGNGCRDAPLPVIAIYLIGFELPAIESSALRVARNYTDLLTQEVISERSDFIEKLSRDCYVVQLSRIDVKRGSGIEQLLSVFEQRNFVDDRGIVKDYEHEIGNEVVRSMLEILHSVGATPAGRKEIENELEAWRTIEALGGARLRQLIIELEQKKSELAEKERALSERT